MTPEVKDRQLKTMLRERAVDPKINAEVAKCCLFTRDEFRDQMQREMRTNDFIENCLREFDKL